MPALERIAALTAANAEQIRRLEQAIARSRAAKDEMRETLRRLVRTVQFHEQRIGRIEGRRAT